ncbi:required for excision 1-B domain-containing protein-like isoform X2 [Ostrea edulis]|uniref:required for excision 1-B domain-containing protein-like isoform X2 n=1 Tax=Ostrea edulis TaxID=37623 RepID=UPI0020960469|nr:required for excision 1-B domain-containing protein-like isoform X2 [Ostrea edulis]
MAEENKGFEGLPAKELLKRFHSLQGERVETYGLFEEGFQAYLNGAPNYNFPMYKQLVHEITQTFSKISQDIILITNQLEDNHNLTSIASIVTGIQNNEKEKLEKTVKLQLARQNATDNPEDSSFKEEEIDLKQSIKDVISAINEQLEELKFESEDLYVDDIDEEKDDEAAER